MRILHLAVYDRNIGDNALNYEIDRHLRFFFPQSEIFHMHILKKVFTSKDLSNLNSYDFLVVGGGGLFTTFNYAKNRNFSGYSNLFRIPNNLLKQITTKVVFYGIGFNNFHGVPLSKGAIEFLRIVKDKGWIFTVRNDGSRKRLADRLPLNLVNVLSTIPDPGCFYRFKRESRQPIVAINIAMDLPERRYQNSTAAVVKSIFSSIPDHLSTRVVLHTPPDKKIDPFVLPYTKKIGGLYSKNEDLDLAWKPYADVSYVIATRGHGQIIPSANFIPTFAISTHPKVIGFAKHNHLRDYCFHLWNRPLVKLESVLRDFFEFPTLYFIQAMMKNETLWLKEQAIFEERLISYVKA